MNFQKLIILMILLGLIVPAVSAAGPGWIILSGGADWLVANGTDSAEIAVQVLDGGGAPLANRTVALDVDPAFGPLAPVFRFSTEDEVGAAANATETGLAANSTAPAAAR